MSSLNRIISIDNLPFEIPSGKEIEVVFQYTSREDGMVIKIDVHPSVDVEVEPHTVPAPKENTSKKAKLVFTLRKGQTTADCMLVACHVDPHACEFRRIRVRT